MRHNNDVTPDEGCGYHHSCVDCPYQICLREECKPIEASQIVKEYRLNPPAPEPEQEPPDLKTSSVWQRPSWWGEKYNIPTTCPHCGSRQCGQDGYPDEVYCFQCGSTILSWVPVPKEWHPPFVALPKFNRTY